MRQSLDRAPCEIRPGFNPLSRPYRFTAEISNRASESDACCSDPFDGRYCPDTSNDSSERAYLLAHRTLSDLTSSMPNSYSNQTAACPEVSREGACYSDGLIACEFRRELD